MKEIFVYADWQNLAACMPLGILRAEQIRNEEVFSFEYHKNWLKGNHTLSLDPELKLYAGPQYLQNEKTNFGLFLDSSPDRWGRMLLQRSAAIYARQAKKRKPILQESDYLLGLNDETRMGALRFKLNENGDFLANDTTMKTPPFSSIRTLEFASRQVENDDFFEQKEALNWLKILIAPGSSLGGARPKANVCDEKGNLWIAKFPSKNDTKDSGAWEYIANEMGKELGLNVCETQAQIFSQKHHTFLSKRFDRNKNKRIHFASAMTLLSYQDGYSHREGGSYLEFVELIEQYGARPTKDLQELWKRIVFSVAISNTDDHLRNHGFLLHPKGWTLSPVYDINPNEFGGGLSLNIDENDNSLNFDLCLSVAAYFRIEINMANNFIEQCKKVVATWHQKGKELNLSNTEISRMETAFITSI